MNSSTKYPLSAEIQALQSLYLNKSLGLFQLFDKFQALPLFTVPQNSVVVDLQNITFGPGRYSIKLDQNSNNSFQIVYYCLLHFIFEKVYDGRNLQSYEKILQYIFNHDIQIEHPEVTFTQEEVKVYLIKFLHILERAKSKRKIVLEELNNLPQINILLVALVKHAARHKELRFQQNAREIQKNIAAAFGIEFDLLSCDLFLFGGEYQVEIRHFDSSCQFAVTHEKPETVQKIKQEFFLGQSAYFMCDTQEQQTVGIQSFIPKIKQAKNMNKVTKKDTIKSIDWVQSEDGETESFRDDPVFDPEKNEDLRKNPFETNFAKSKIFADLFSTKDKFTGESMQEAFAANKPRILNFEQIIRQNTQGQISEPAETVRSTTCFKGLQTSSTTSFLNQKSKYHKPSFCQTDYSRPLFRHMSISKSVQEIKLPQRQLQRQQYRRKERRVPTFILKRMKENNIKQKITPPKMQENDNKAKPIFPRITFTYTTK